MTPERLTALPKIDLHCHVDGAARPGTLLELARGAGLALPSDTLDGLLPHVRVSPGCRSLREFLTTFESFYPVLSVPGAMQRVAHELVEDAAADGVIHLEARFCPALQAGEQQDAAAVTDAVLAGLASGAAATGISWGAIVCCYRPLSHAVNAELVELALSRADRGVVAVDLAGPEDLPGAPFADLIARARDGGLGVTIHAGEAAGPESVLEAIEQLGAQRLGHAVALADDDALRARVLALGLGLECCLTSNLQTGAVTELGRHPFATFLAEGHAVTLNTDDPAVCGVTLSGELALAATTFGLADAELAALQVNAAHAAFLDDDGRRALLARLSG